MPNVTVNLPDSMLDRVKEIEEEHNTTRAAAVRSVINSGLRASKYHDEFTLDPENWEMDNCVDLAKKGELPR